MGEAVVIKIGGALTEPDGLPAAFWADVAALRAEAPVVLVHGGGPQATQMAARLGHTPRIVQGRRVTTDLDLAIMQWVLRGTVNTGLVARAQQHRLPAVGLSGVDGGLVRVTRRPPWVIDGEAVDFGWVGDVASVAPAVLARLFEGGFLPVVAPLALDGGGQVYNVNADTIALALAAALDAASLLMVTESGGLKRDVSDEAVLPLCDRATYDAGVRDGWIAGGMRVKLHVAFEALEAGVEAVFILAPEDLLRRHRATQVVASASAKQP